MGTRSSNLGPRGTLGRLPAVIVAYVFCWRGSRSGAPFLRAGSDPERDHGHP
jgi:hypothetical protein